jgi:hypothetical protein
MMLVSHVLTVQQNYTLAKSIFQTDYTWLSIVSNADSERRNRWNGDNNIYIGAKYTVLRC